METDKSQYEIHYRSATRKEAGHRFVLGLDQLLDELTRLKDQGAVILGVSNLTELQK